MFGYRYDTETQLYYLQSRYYNPDWGRFINADALGGKPGELLSHNMFAYCGNNPVNMSDPDGNKFSLNDLFQSAKSVISNAINTIAQHAVATVAATVILVAGVVGISYVVTHPRTASVMTSGGAAASKAVSKVKTSLQTYYPPNNGALGDVERKYLMPEDKIDRFGKLGGKYFSPVGTPMKMRALPAGADLSQYRVFEVVKPFEVESSTIAPAFNQIGLGTQFRSPVSAETLLNRGIIKIFP